MTKIYMGKLHVLIVIIVNVNLLNFCDDGVIANHINSVIYEEFIFFNHYSGLKNSVYFSLNGKHQQIVHCDHEPES